MRLRALQSLPGQLQQQLRIVTALAGREMHLRASKGLFGLFGLFVEPLALISTFMLLRVFLRGSGDGTYMNNVLFLALGFVPFYMFSDIAIRAIGGVERSNELYFYRRIRPLDTLMGSAWLLTQVFGSLFVIFILVISLVEWRFAVYSLAGIIFLFLGVSILGFGIGITTLVVGHRLPFIAWIMKMVLRRVLLWTSCVFFSISVIPDVLRPWILWNPLAHGIELLRISCNPAYPAPGVSASYFWIWVVASVGVGLLIYGNNEELLFSMDASPLDVTINDGD
jgi:ABC-type polysaccharide/polyol phosphate export systems, permease component